MKRQSKSSMYTIMDLLINPSERFPPHQIILKKGNPIWKEKPSHAFNWPVIPKATFKRLLKKGWLEQVDDCWIASQLGIINYRSIGPFRYCGKYHRKPSTISKYRKRMKNREMFRKYLDKQAEAKKSIEPPLRKERTKKKVFRAGYHRECERQWTQYEEDYFHEEKSNAKQLMTVEEALDLIKQMGEKS